jgi:hypothetical protein
MFFSCECLCCQVERSLRRADPSSTGVLPTMMCVWMWSSEITEKKPRHLLWAGRRGKDCETNIGTLSSLSCGIPSGGSKSWLSHYLNDSTQCWEIITVNDVIILTYARDKASPVIRNHAFKCCMIWSACKRSSHLRLKWWQTRWLHAMCLA